MAWENSLVVKAVMWNFMFPIIVLELQNSALVNAEVILRELDSENHVKYVEKYLILLPQE
jgi:hypothetical protein